MAEQTYFDQEEAAAYIRVSEATFKRHVSEAVPCSFIGAKKVFSRIDLDAFMTDHRAFATDRPQRKKGNANNLVKMNPKAAALAEQMKNGTKTKTA